MAENEKAVEEKEAATEVQADQSKEQAASPKKRAAPKRKTTKKASSKQVIFVKSKRKRAVARASATGGSGRIRLNGFDILTYDPVALRQLMLEPLGVSSLTTDLSKGMDIKVTVKGGGQSSQAQAVRGAIAKSIVAYSSNDAVKKVYMSYDRFMLIDDARRVEPKKFKGPKARARFQKSYR